MGAPNQKDQGLAREARGVAVVIAATGLLWLGAQWLVGPGDRYAVLFDLAALAAFFWALVVTWRIWRRQKRQGE
ncbi:DUF5337 domain-containing protein [Defluviimonas salinarum]|uniref:DUF5337 domain-containing protein n=1 Tax=Defluviimonas salinarum TaxID=2992147 RepID=A0ABT3J0H0_9RHOB|nr:DUF5337 domain-containing protein [Defluviimonas salinarum]MCW3780924.1 DUF5337 domain-containing protein [Defluviimonas salinarum]